MKDFMASGSFSRGRDVINANAAMVFVGNINQRVDTLVKTSHLFAPFPEEMIDSAFFDRMHTYLPGWEIPKMRPEFLTNQYGLIVDFLAEFLREMIILGDMSLGGTIEKASNLAETLQVGFDAGAKRILIPMSSVGDIPSIPGELFAKFQTSFYSDPVDAVYKALGVE